MGWIRYFYKGFKEGLRIHAQDISTVLNALILMFVYFFGVGFTSLISKIFRKHFLDIKTQKKAKSYWSVLNLGKKQRNEYYNQI